MEQFLKMLEQAAQAVGMEAVRVWPDIVAITYTKALTGLIVTLVFVAVFAALGVKFLMLAEKAQAERTAFFNAYDRNKEKKDSYGCWKEDDCGEGFDMGVAMICLIIAITVFIGLCVSMPDIVAALTHPEAKTVLDILKVK